MTLTKIVTAAALAAASMTTMANAQDTYVSVYGGLSFPTDTDLDGDVGGAPQSVDLEWDDGSAIGIAVGRDLTDLGSASLRGEIELSYTANDVDDIFFSGNGPAAEINVDGDLSTTRLFANVIADFDTGSPITPYAGGGLGLSRSEFDVSYGPGVTLDDESDNVSAQVIFGASYEISDTVSIFSDVRFIRDFDVETDRFSPTGALTGQVSDDIDTTNLTIGASFSF